MLTFVCVSYSCLIQKKGTKALYELQHSVANVVEADSLSIMTAPATDEGNAEAGYKYLIEGNAFRSGIPLRIYKYLQLLKNSSIAEMAGYSKFVSNDFIIFKNESGRLIATPGCLHCHSQQFNNELVIGLGNSYSNFQVNTTPYLKLIERVIKTMYGKNSSEWKAAETAFQTGSVLSSRIVTQMQGPNPAHRIAEVMASHRDPETLIFRTDTNYFSIPSIVIPNDVPALWLSKRKKAFTVNAMEQGSYLKHLMSPAILTFKDSAEAREIYNNIKDVWEYIKTMEPPKYPYSINKKLAEEGKLIFLKTCSPCHGTYGNNGYYPNKLISGDIIGTDSMMWKYYIKYPEYAEWFNKSWFATTTSPAFIKPQPGYVPPPLDGVWITAPYLHNGSVPTVEAVLNSELRPRYWKRSFSMEKYDYEKLGWQYKTLAKPGGKKTYDTDIPGYGNYGHYFGDHLSDEERKAVIEYLKTL